MSGLAGSALPITAGIENMVRFGICGFPEAIQMASVRPARAMGMQEVNLQAGDRADLVLFQWNERERKIHVKKTIVNGKVIYDGRH